MLPVKDGALALIFEEDTPATFLQFGFHSLGIGFALFFVGFVLVAGAVIVEIDALVRGVAKKVGEFLRQVGLVAGGVHVKVFENAQFVLRTMFLGCGDG